MSKRPVTCRAEEKIRDALIRMKKYGVRRLAVVNKDGKLMGELTLHHLVLKYYRACQYYEIVKEKKEKK